LLNKCVKLFDVEKLVLGQDRPRALAVHGVRAWVTCYYSDVLYHIRLSPSLAVCKTSHMERLYTDIAYLAGERLVAVDYDSLEIHILSSHTGELRLTLTPRHRFGAISRAASHNNDTFIADIGDTNTGIFPSIVCLTWNDTSSDRRWIHELPTYHPIDIAIGLDSLFVMCGQDTVMQIGLVHGERQAVLTLPTGCPALRAGICCYDNVLYAGCQKINMLVELRILGNYA
jgi:hypothetical protein